MWATDAPCLGLLAMYALGFKARVGPPACVLCHLYVSMVCLCWRFTSGGNDQRPRCRPTSLGILGAQ